MFNVENLHQPESYQTAVASSLEEAVNERSVKIDDVVRLPTTQSCCDLLSGARSQFSKRFLRQERRMRSDEHSWIGVRRLREIRRFGILHIKCSTRKPTFRQRLRESRMVDQPASGRINQKGTWFHEGQFFCIQQVSRLSSQRQMK